MWQLFIDYPQVLSRPELNLVFQDYQVRYVLLHLKGDREWDMWQTLSQNPAFPPVDCFDPLEGPSPWSYPICVAQVEPFSLPSNLLRIEGWSGLEEWGVWAQADESRAIWLVEAQKDQRLLVEAFPLCLPDRQQEVAIEVNGHPLTTHQWQACESWSEAVPIPASLVQPGWNELSFRYGYATSSADDPRPLAVGFTRLEVEPR